MRFLRALAALPALLLLAACGDSKVASSAKPDLASVENFLGERLPDHARDIRTQGEQGMDSLVLLRLDAPEREAALFAERLLGTPPKAGVDPQLGTFGSDVDWWQAKPPAGSSGGSATHSKQNRTYRVLLAPAGEGMSRLWVAAFSN